MTPEDSQTNPQQADRENRSLDEILSNRQESRRPHQSNIRRSSVPSETPGAKPWFIVAAIVTVLAAAAGLLIFHPADPKPAALTENVLAPAAPAVVIPYPAPGPQDPRLPGNKQTAEQSDDFPRLIPRESVTAAASPILQLPIQVADYSLDWITRSIVENSKLPATNAVRLEEILNRFPLRLAGVVATAPGRSASAPLHLASVTTETIPCPWKPSATLLLILLRGNPTQDCEINMAFHSDMQGIFRYRLLGFSTAEDQTVAPLSTRLLAGKSIIHALEIEPAKPDGPLGTLQWTVNNSPAPSIPIRHRADAEPSDDARFAALVCCFAQWLSGVHSGIIDDEIVTALAREIASDSLPPERTEFLNLIDRAIHF
jgi:hypothetical protein